MVQLNTLAIAAILGSAASVFAAPAAEVATLAERGSCVFSGSSGAAQVKSQKASCSTITLNSLVVPAGQTLDLTGLKSGTKVVFEGTTTFGYKEWEGPLVSVSGTNIQVSGASGATLDGQGSRWWDGKGTNGGKTKPKFFYAHSMKGTSSIKGIKIKDSPVQIFSINSSQGLTVSGVTIDNSDGTKLGHNTDAFDVGSSSNIIITGNTIMNQDDCLAINSGTGIQFTNNKCSGGHGISIGSVGGRSDNVVKTVTVTGNTITNSMNGLRIKTVYGATGSVSGVTYTNNKMSGITDYGIVVEQDYENGSPTGKPTAGVPISDIHFDGVTGSVGAKATPVYILCASCTNWSWKGVSLTGGVKSSKCKGIPSGASC